MAHFEDLQPCIAFPGEWRNLLAVGWLAKGHEFTRGPVDAQVLRRLADPVWRWEPPEAPQGRHVCDLCSEEDDPRHGSGALFVRGDGVLYVAPRLITHYIRKHSYQPPAAFLRALEAVPEDTQAYRNAVVAHLVGHVEPQHDRSAYITLPIRVLEGLEPIRVRPGMYVGPTDSRGISRMLWLIVGLGVEQHLEGGASHLRVDINDAGWVTVEDDGPGISVEPLPAPHTLSMLEYMFGTLLMGPPRSEHPLATVPVKHGPGFARTVAITTGLASRLDVETRRDGVAWRLGYTGGIPTRPLVRAGPTSLRGTVVRYRPDDELFDEGARHDLEAIERLLIDVARLCPKLDVQFQGRSLRRPDGLPGWLREVAPELVNETLLTGSGTVKEVDVEFALAWRPRATGSLVRSFVNYGETPEGGSHERGLVSAVEQVISAKRASRKKKVVSGLVGIVHVGLRSPNLAGMWSGLDDDSARVAVRDVVTRAINEAPWWWDRLHTAIG